MTSTATRSRELLILRHAKSAWDTDAPTDHDRPLAARGRRDCPRVARWIRARGLIPERIVSSTSARTRETIRRVIDELDADVAVAFDRRLYHAELPELLAVIGEISGDVRRAMIVGHNPGLEDLVTHLGGPDAAYPDRKKLMPTAAVAHFRLPADWSELARGSGELIALVRPKELD